MKFSFLLWLMMCVGCAQQESAQVARVPLSGDPATSDPREARDLISMSLVKMLYDGLTRIGPDGPVLSLAESVEESGARYTFHLRHAEWSNGDPITSYDFARSWSQVGPPQSTFLECLAEVETPNARTLIVELKEPLPYFLELVALAPYYPIHPEAEVYSGPFCLKEWRHNECLHLVRNEKYWDEITLDGIDLWIVPDEMTALYLFEQGKLDWAGSPLSRLPNSDLGADRTDVAATTWYFLNTKHPELQDPHIRRALSAAIDRRKICDHLHVGAPVESVEGRPTLSTMPQLTLSYAQNEHAHVLAQAIQQQWREVLGLEVTLECMELTTLLDKVNRGDYCIAHRNWFADVDHPSNTQAFLDEFSDLEVIPLFYNQYRYRGTLAGVVLPRAGAPDFKWAHR